VGFENKKLSYRRGTARCVVSVEILPIATQQCRNYLYDKSWPNRWYEVGNLVGGNARSVRRRAHIKVPRQRRCLTTSNCLRLLSIKRKFPWYICNSFSQPRKKDSRFKARHLAAVRGNPTTGGNPPKMPGINTMDQPCVRIPSSASVASLPLHRYMKQFACHSIFIIFWNTENYFLLTHSFHYSIQCGTF